MDTPNENLSEIPQILVDEYNQLNEHGRTFYRSAFSLAAMSFAINGTLATASGYLFFNTNIDKVFEAQSVIAFISIVAIVYNLGAAVNVVSTSRRMSLILKGMEELEFHHHLIIPGMYRQARHQFLEGALILTLNVLFFCLLIFGWSYAFRHILLLS